jgi:four helix bundle protein
MQPYERLIAWQRCHELVLAIHPANATWPTQERYGITAQVRRAALSAATNLVEGSAKLGRLEFRRYLDISLGSLAEAGYLLRVARDLGILATDQWTSVEKVREEAAKLVWLLYRSLGKRAERRSTPSADARAP